ncbi:hypothetical protein MPSEU_000612900 [Mayamaea pseudoterrestris]|nr:hypothetical protein MPSEU_000612900 [Mayamaea pseudoterrestris]
MEHFLSKERHWREYTLLQLSLYIYRLLEALATVLITLSNHFSRLSFQRKESTMTGTATMLFRRTRLSKLLFLSLYCSNLVTTTANPVVIPLVPHHKQRARRHLQNVAFSKVTRPVPWHARRNLANQDNDENHKHQVAALYQGYGTHYADLWCGTPPQRQTVIVDTGSGVTAFPCSGCSDCGVPTYHLDELFNFAESTSYRQLTCSECLKGSCRGSSQCQIGMSYQEGSSWSAYEVQDSCYVGGLHHEAVTEADANRNDDLIHDALNPMQAENFAFPLKFGCQTKLTGLFKTQLADGIMGMDNADTSFWSQMSNSLSIVDRTFSLCFSRSPTASRDGTGSGAMTLGGYDDRLHESTMVYAGISKGQGFYNVQVRKMYLRTGGGESALGSGSKVKVVQLNIGEYDLNRGNVIIDSGTTDTYYNSAIGRECKNVYKSLAGSDFSHNSITLTHDELLALPTILIQLQGDETTNRMIAESSDGPVVGLAGDLDAEYPYDVILAIPASHYFEYDETDNKYTNRFYVEEGGGTVIGANSIMGHDVYFDIDGSRVGFAESSCDYETLVQPFLEAGHILPADNESRQSGQATEGDDVAAGDDTTKDEPNSNGEGGTDTATDDDGADDGTTQLDPSSTGETVDDESFCDQYPCQSLLVMCGMMIVSMVIITLVLRRRKGPRYSEATMSELELRVTSSADDDEVDFSDSYRDLHAREIT